METPRTDAIDQALESLRGQIRGARSTGARRRPWTVRRILRNVAIGLLAVLLPFLLLLKIAVVLYLEAGIGPWLSLSVSAFVATILLTAVTMVLSFRVRRRFVVTPFTFRSIAALVTAYCLYSLLFISGANVKSSAVAETYSALHPLLRLSISTLVLADDGLVVTDAARMREDYETMGLPVNERSMHLVQGSGYVHAVDLRTIGRSPVRNALVAGYFRLMGFRTLRHVGTADHLHVSLAVR